MVKCPKCKEEIEELREVLSGYRYGSIYLDGNHVEYEDDEFDTDDNVTEYSCPSCGEILFTNYDKAEKFLKQELDDLAELVEETLKNGNNKKQKKK